MPKKRLKVTYWYAINYFQSGCIVLYMHVWQEFGPTHSDYDCGRYGLCYYVDKGSHLWLLHETAVSSHTHTLTHRAQCLPQTSLHVSGWTVQWYGYINATLEQTYLKLDTWCRYLLVWIVTHALWIMHTAQVCAYCRHYSDPSCCLQYLIGSSVQILREKTWRSHHMWWCYVMVDTWKWCSTNNLEGSCL